MLKAILDRAREVRATEIEGEEAAEAGFTLIELMVVLLIIAILLAIAIPTFLGVTGSANDRAAQSNLTNAATESSAYYQSNNQSYGAVTSMVTAMSSSAPEFAWNAATASGAGTCSGGANCISVWVGDVAATGDQNAVILASKAKTNTCWFVMVLNANPNGTATGTGGWLTSTVSTGGTYYAQVKNAGSCTAFTGSSATFKWGSSYANAPSN